jgi:hypothetical protein
LEQGHIFTLDDVYPNSTIPQNDLRQQEIRELTSTPSLCDFCVMVSRVSLPHLYFADERTTTLFAELASEFVDMNIPVVDEDNRMELAMMLLESLDIIAR